MIALKNYKILKNKTFEKNNIKLCPISKHDVEKIRIWRNQQILNLRQKKKITKEDQKKYFKKIIFKEYENIKPKNLIFSIKENSKLIGYGGLVHISWSNFRAEVSLLFKTDLEKNKKIKFFYFKIFLNLIKEVSFNSLGLKKIYTETYSIRKKEILFLEKYGFKREGILKNHVYINKKAHDIILHGFNN
jgi:RimJ/RimL family protein N-acetyltransferase